MPANDKEAHVPIWFTLVHRRCRSRRDSSRRRRVSTPSPKSPRSSGRCRTAYRRDQGDGQHQVGRHRAQARRRSGQGALWNWRKLIVDGKLKEARKDCTITMMDYELNPVVTYSIINAWPKKYTGVGLKADSNEVAVEGITLCHEGFEIK